MKKISIVLALILVVALAMPAMAKTNLSHYVEFENNFDDKTNSQSSTVGYYYLFVNADPAENVHFYSELDFHFNFNQDGGSYGTDNYDGGVDVFEAWAKIDKIAGPLSLKIGKMQEYSAGIGGNAKIGSTSALYAFDTQEFGVVGYQSGNFSGKLGHSVDNDKVTFAEGKVTGLGVLDEATLNYVDDTNDTNDYNGYTLNLAKQFEPVKVDFVYGDASNENGGNDLDASLTDIRFSSDQLLPGANVGLEYAVVEAGYVNSDIVMDSEESTLITDSSDDLTTSVSVNDDVTIIRPSVNFDLTDKLNVGLSYGMREADNKDAEHNYLHVYSVYNVAKSTILELEVFDHSYDGADTSGNDYTQVETTLGISF